VKGESRENMISILELKDIHAGRPGAVLGGGPSLQTDIERIPPGAVLISVNYHALQIVNADYLVFWDSPACHPAMLEAWGRYKGVKVSPLAEWTDVDLSGVEWWRGCFSSHLATWFACWLGCDPVLLAGMDCYQGPRPADADPRNYAYKMPLKEHLDGWREAFKRCPHPERIQAISGPLVEVFGRFIP
jgi:hypothetical protein